MRVMTAQAAQDGRLGDASLPQETYTADTQAAQDGRLGDASLPQETYTADTQAAQDGRLGEASLPQAQVFRKIFDRLFQTFFELNLWFPT